MDPDSVDCDFAILDARSSERFYGKVPELDQAYGQVTSQGLQIFHFLIYCEDENAMLFKENEELLESFRSRQVSI